MTKFIVAGLLAFLATVSSARADTVIRDNISNNSWQQSPVLSLANIWDSVQYTSAVTYTGNGHQLGRLSVIATFRIAAVPGIPMPGQFTVRVGSFTSVADFQGNPFRVSREFNTSEFLNSNWQTPIATIDGIPYLRIDLPLTSLGVTTTNGATELLSWSFDDQTIMPGVRGRAICTGPGFGTGPDDYYRLLSGSTNYNGTLLGYLSGLGYSDTHFAAEVATVPAPSAAGLLTLGLLTASRRRR